MRKKIIQQALDVMGESEEKLLLEDMTAVGKFSMTLYKAFQNAGFTKEESFSIVKSYVIEMLTGGK